MGQDDTFISSILILILTSYLRWNVTFITTLDLPHTKRITIVSPRAMHCTIDGTQSGSPACMYNISLCYQRGSMQRDGLTKAEHKTWACVHVSVCACACGCVRGVVDKKIFFNYQKKKGYKATELCKWCCWLHAFLWEREEIKNEETFWYACLYWLRPSE